MKDHYSEYTRDDLWCIKEHCFEPEIQNIRESQFTLGNGYMGARAVLEERPEGARPGTYIAGVYDRLTSQVSELVNLPNPFFFKFVIKGEKVGATAMDTLGHERILNMKDGLLLRRTIYSDVRGKRYDYQSIRFLSVDNKNVGVMQIILTPIDDAAEIQVQSDIDVAVFNSGVVTEGDKEHFQIRELFHKDNISYRLIETLEKRHRVIYRNGFFYKIGNKKQYASGAVLRLKLKKRQPVIFTSYFYIRASAADDNLDKFKKASEVAFRKIFRTKFETLLHAHIKRMNELWKVADVIIKGTLDIQKNVRFNIYHMLICAQFNDGFSSIGARTLSGEGYRGHIFWDAEIFMLPFYEYIMPDIAKNMLLYRYHRLDHARTIARQKGYKGAMFPWESAGTGEEETPSWAKNLDGSIIRIKTNVLEHHITADIAFACYNYGLISGDMKFMHQYGYELIFEAARFWASRVTRNRKDKYEIKDVMGPDEFHEHVNNDIYTNVIAKWDLLTAYNCYLNLKKDNPELHKELKTSLNLTDKEVKRWKYISPRIVTKTRKDGVIEQFDGFFRKRLIKITSYDENGIPTLPKGVKVKDYNTTQLVKQADVLMLLVLFSNVYSKKIKESNYRYYTDRTLHKSSLSPPMHCLAALEIGVLSEAYRFFNVALRADISNLHGNTAEGVHAASLGGVWQCVVNGFGGIRIKGDNLSIDPFMPKTWKSIRCSIFWKNNLVKIEARNNEVRIKIESKQKTKKKVEIFNKMHVLSVNKEYVFHRLKARVERHYYL